MAINFPDSPTNGQSYTDSGTGQTWTYELATNSWTASTLATTGGVVYKGSVDITAAPPTGAAAGEQWSVGTGGTANAGYGPGVTGTITKGSMVMYTGSGWLETNHTVPEATPAVKGIDTRKWDRTGTVLSPATAGDVVNISAGTAALPGLTPVGDADTGIFFPAADTIAFAEGGKEAARLDASGKLLIGTSSATSNTRLGQKAAVVSTGSANFGGLSVTSYSGPNPGTGPIIDLQRSKGTTDGSLTEVVAGDLLGYLVFRGSDGAAFSDAAHISGWADGDWTTSGDTSDSPGRLVFSTTADGESGPTERMRIDSNGVSIYAIPPAGQPTFKVQTGGTTWSVGSVGTNTPYYITSSSGAGVSLLKGGTSWSTSSDERLKENLTPIANGLDKVSTLRACTGKYINDEPGTSRSFLIAQDVHAVLPEAVSEDENEDKTLNLRYTEVIPLLVAALKESKERIEHLESEMAAVKSRFS